jgi:hypothetical protein
LMRHGEPRSCLIGLISGMSSRCSESLLLLLQGDPRRRFSTGLKVVSGGELRRSTSCTLRQGDPSCLNELVASGGDGKVGSQVLELVGRGEPSSAAAVREHDENDVLVMEVVVEVPVLGVEGTVGLVITASGTCVINVGDGWLVNSFVTERL